MSHNANAPCRASYLSGLSASPLTRAIRVVELDRWLAVAASTPPNDDSAVVAIIPVETAS